MSSTEHIEEKLRSSQELGDLTHLEVVDMSDGCGAKFQTVIVSSKFEGLPLLQRHRLVNKVLEEELKVIHAFQMKTLTPEQWEKTKAS